MRHCFTEEVSRFWRSYEKYVAAEETPDGISHVRCVGGDVRVFRGRLIVNGVVIGPVAMRAILSEIIRQTGGTIQ